MDRDPKAELIAAPFEQRLAEAIQLHEEALAGNEDALWEANRVIERLRLDYPGHAIADAYHGSVLVLLAGRGATRWNGESGRGADLSFFIKLPLVLPKIVRSACFATTLHSDRLNA
jgi:hypothetical protein